jgi:hypothetical protein
LAFRQLIFFALPGSLSIPMASIFNFIPGLHEVN